MLSFFVWMLTSAENVTEEAQPSIEEQVEYRTRLSVAFQLFLPVAGLLFFIFKQKNILNRFLLQLDRNCVSVFCPSFSKREKLLTWASGRLPTTWSSTSKTLSGGITELWSDGSLLCTLINTAVPGACPNPYRHWKKPPTHAQAIAYKYLGIVPLFTDKELHEVLDPDLENNFFHYLSELQKAIANLSENKDNITAVSEQYITRGMGLFSGEQHRKTIFYIYLDDSAPSKNNSTVLIQIRGPYSTFGKAIIPKFPNSLFNSPESENSFEKMPMKNFKPKSNFMKKFSLPFVRYHKKHNGDNITIDVVIEGSRAKITYIPKNFGMYEINMVANGELLKGCPFSVHIFKNTSGLKDTLEYKLPETTTYKTRKIISKTIDLVDETVPISKLKEKYRTHKKNNEEEEIREMNKYKFNFDEVVKEITKNGVIFNNDNKYFTKEEKSTKDGDVDFQLANNYIPTIEEVEEVVESELESGLGFSETISEISNEYDDFHSYLENKKDSNFSSLESQDLYPAIPEENLEIANNQEVLNVEMLNVESNDEIVKVDNAKSILTKHTSQNNVENAFTQPRVVIKEYINKEHINKVKIPERFSEFNRVNIDSKYIKNVVNSSSKKEFLEKYFQSNEKNDKNIEKFSETFQKCLAGQVKTHQAVTENVVILPSRLIMDQKVINNEDINTNCTKKSLNDFLDENIPAIRRISSKEFFQQMLESDDPETSKETLQTTNETKNNPPTRYLIEKCSRRNEHQAIIAQSNFKRTVESDHCPSHKVPEQLQIVQTSNLIDTSPICSSYIEPEVEYQEMSVDEKRKIFALKNLVDNSTSKSSSFSEMAENVEVSKPQRHLQFEGLSVLNVLGSLKQSQSVSSVLIKRPLSSTASLPNISSIEHEYVFPQLVKEKKTFWEDMFDQRIKNKTETPTDRKIRTVCIRSRTVDALTENVIKEQIPKLFSSTTSKHSSKIATEFENLDVQNLVKEKTNFWESTIPNSFREKQKRTWNKGKETHSLIKQFSVEPENSSLSSQESSSLFSIETSCTSLPNISFSNDQNLVKQKKCFWEKLPSRSSTSLAIRPTRPKLNENERIKLIWKKPDQQAEDKIKSKEENPVDIYKSADDILSMTDYYPHQSFKRYKSMDNSLDNCTKLSIEERKKMLLKQHYEKEQLEKEKIVSIRRKVNMVQGNIGKDGRDKRTSESSYFSPVGEKIRKFNSVSNLDFIQQEKKKPDPRQEPTRTDAFQIKDNSLVADKLKLRSHFKRAVKYFKNLEAKSLGKVKSKSSDRFTTKLTLAIHHSKSPSYRGGSLNFSNASKRFSVSNLYEDVIGNRKGSFRGTPNRSALVEALATFSRKQISENQNDNEDSIRYEIFKNIKTKRRRSLRSVFDIYY